MASSYTEGLVIELIGSGDKAGSWGDVTNSNLQALNQGVSGFSDIDLSSVGSSPYTIDLVDAQAVSESTSPSRSSVIRFDGHSDGFQVNFQTNTSASERINCIIVNGHASNSLVVGTGTGGTVTIPATYSARIHGDGSGLENSFANLAVDKIALKNNEIISNETNDEIVIGADTVKVGDDGAATLSSNGNQDLILKTGNTATGSITITDGSNENIDITPNGTGKVVMDKVNIGGGEIDGTPIGANSANTGSFTSVGTTSNGAITANGSGNISSTTGNISTGGSISTSGSGTMTSAGLLTASGGVSTTAVSSASAITISTTSGDNDINLTPHNNGEVNISKVDIDDGTISGTVITNSSIGSSSPSTGAFTTLSATGTSTLAAINASGNIATSGSTTITAANGLVATAGGLTVNAGGIDVNGGGLDLAGGGITNAGNIEAGTVTASLTGNVTGNVSGNAGTVTNGVYTTNKINVLASTSSAELAGVISDNTGTGSLVFSNSPTLVSPDLGTPDSGVMTNVTGTAAGLTAGSATLAISTSALKSASTTVNVDSSSAPSAGQVLTATSASAAEWQDSTVGDITEVTGGTNITVTSGGGPVPDVNLDTVISLTSVVAAVGVSAPFITTSSNADLLIRPNGSGRVSIPSASTASSEGSEAININASAGRIGLQVGENADLITFRIPISSAPTTPVFQGFFNQNGLALHNAGGQYLNFTSGTGASGNGIRGDGNLPLEFKAKPGTGGSGTVDNWGRPYHSGMVSGDGAYVEVTSSYTGASGAAISFDISSLGVTSGDVPRFVELWAKRVSGDDDIGYSEGDWIKLESRFKHGADEIGYGIWATNSTVNIKAYNEPNWLFAPNKSSGADQALSTAGGWTIYVRAWK
jgi:hypothetical protein